MFQLNFKSNWTRFTKKNHCNIIFLLFLFSINVHFYYFVFKLYLSIDYPYFNLFHFFYKPPIVDFFMGCAYINFIEFKLNDYI